MCVIQWLMIKDSDLKAFYSLIAGSVVVSQQEVEVLSKVNELIWVFFTKSTLTQE